MMFLGFLWAAFAPLMLLVPMAVLALTFGRMLPPRGSSFSRLVPRALAVVLVIGPTAALWLADRADFRQVCDGVGAAVIYRKASAEGVLLDSGTSNSFGMRYMQEEGFMWMEAQDIYNRDAYVRYTRNPDKTITTTKIDAPTARYLVQETVEKPYSHTSLSVTHVIDRITNEELARAGTSQFDGGRAKWVLGAWGTLSCPGASAEPEEFWNYYHLARRTLR